MSLIKCPECGREVSDKSKQCIHCGYPIHEVKDGSKVYSITITKVTGNNRYIVADALEHRYGVSDYKTITKSALAESLKYLPKTIVTGIPHKYIDIVRQDLESTFCSVKIEEYDGDENTQIDYQAITDRLERIKAKSRCPRCSSDKITTSSRGYSLLWGFLGSGSTVNRCGNCGYTWKP